MRQEFNSQMEAITWIADYAKSEAHFEIMREELTFNHIYTGEFFIHPNHVDMEVIMLDEMNNDITF